MSRVTVNVVGLLDALATECARRSADLDVAYQVAAALIAERDALVVRRDGLLALVAKLTRETPYPDEANECRSQRASLIAEVGTLRSDRDAHAARCVELQRRVTELESEAR